jgi:uncharacterized membrane protein
MAHVNKKFVSKDDINFRWKSLSVPAVIQGMDQKGGSTTFHVSNDLVPFPSGLTVIDDYVSEQDSEELHKEIHSLDFTWEGFEQRRRVQRYTVDDALPKTLRALVDRIASGTGRRAQHISVEEYSSLQTLKFTQYGSNGYNGL